MNKDRILALAEFIERQPHTSVEAKNGFTMTDYVHSCGTPACIAGWASAASKSGGNPGEPVDLVLSEIHGEATNYLGLDSCQADGLFLPDDYSWRSITPYQAAATLRRLAETGEVEWGI